jgi:hypothetical protein
MLASSPLRIIGAARQPQRLRNDFETHWERADKVPVKLYESLFIRVRNDHLNLLIDDGVDYADGFR